MLYNSYPSFMPGALSKLALDANNEWAGQTYFVGGLISGAYRTCRLAAMYNGSSIDLFDWVMNGWSTPSDLDVCIREHY